eukprot:3989140-Alexandrium_andersonii.AAC.1
MDIGVADVLQQKPMPWSAHLHSVSVERGVARNDWDGGGSECDQIVSTSVEDQRLGSQGHVGGFPSGEHPLESGAVPLGLSVGELDRVRLKAPPGFQPP